MKRFKGLLLGFLILSVIGCTGKEGPTGPQGPQGNTGPKGDGYFSVTLGSDKDNTIDSSVGNFGTQPTIVFGPSSGTASRTIMHFDFSSLSLPTDAVIVDAIVTFFPALPGPGVGTLLTCNVYPLLQAFSETASTWIKADSTHDWVTAGGDYDANAKIGVFSIIPTTETKFCVNLDPAWVQNWIAGQYNHGILIKAAVESGNNNISVYSRDYTGDTAKRPSLRLIYGRTSTFGTTSAQSIRVQYQKKVLGLR